MPLPIRQFCLKHTFEDAVYRLERALTVLAGRASLDGIRPGQSVARMNTEERQAARILLIEDNEGDVYLLSLALEQAGFPHTLTILRDGSDAIAFVRHAPSLEPSELPDLVLVDFNLPDIDGIALIRAFRAEPALCQIPIMLLSSSRSPELSACASQFNKCIFALKPSTLSAYMAIGAQAKEFCELNR